MIRCIRASVVTSTLLVASSSRRMQERRSSARASAKSCCYPWLKGWDCILASSPPRSRRMGQRVSFWSASMICSSGTLPKGSILCRTVPVRMNESCGIAVMRERISSRGRIERSISSIEILPRSRSRGAARSESYCSCYCLSDRKYQSPSLVRFVRSHLAELACPARTAQ